MPREPRIVIADRSELAANLYRLLFMGLGATLTIRKRYEEARPHFFRREKVDLGIFNSNIFGKKFHEIIGNVRESDPLLNCQKIFLCREGELEQTFKDEIKKIPNSIVVEKPFHPDGFLKIVSGIIKT